LISKPQRWPRGKSKLIGEEEAEGKDRRILEDEFSRRVDAIK
jgi:hypothetical protein